MHFKKELRATFVPLTVGMIILLMASCAYTPDEINFIKKDSTITNHLIVTLGAQTPDTLLILDATTISYKVDVGAGESVFSEIKITGPENFNPPVTRNDKNFSFVINPFGYKTGVYKMTVTVISGTGTGTLREKFGAEALVASFEKVLVFDNHPPEEIAITQVTEQDGSVVVRWPKYPYKNLKSITLLRVIDYYYETETKSFTISGQRTFFKDSSFVGGTAKYRIQTNVYQANTSKTGPSFTFAGKPGPTIKSFRTQKGTTSLALTWSRLRYPSNFKSYKIYDQGSTTPLHTITNVSDTVRIISNNYRLGEYRNLYVIAETYGGKTVLNPTNIVRVYLGEKTAVPSYTSLFFSNDTHRVYAFKSARFSVWKDNILSDSIPMEYGHTIPFLAILPHAGTSLFVHNWGLAKFNHENLVFEKFSSGYYCMPGKITNDNFVIYSIKDTPNCYPDPGRPPGIALYNYVQNLSLDTLTTYPNVATAPAITFTEIGYDERTLLVKNANEFRIAKFDQTHFISDQSIGIPISFEAHFLPVDNNKIYGFNSTQTMVYTISTGQFTVKSLSETIILPELDQVSGWLGGLNVSRTKYMIFDVTTGQKLKEIDLPPVPYYLDYNDPTTFYLWAKKLYMKPGFVLDLE